MDANKLERLVASFGFLSRDFVESLNRAEKDYASGRYRKVKSLQDLRR
ncbi:MAG: hypothetical protein HY434_00165 [Candidatus Liptonbacteria bacterium]|nr:hypothetical protein [Candidatus Liptonbacteria bacterium]